MPPPLTSRTHLWGVTIDGALDSWDSSGRESDTFRYFGCAVARHVTASRRDAISFGIPGQDRPRIEFKRLWVSNLIYLLKKKNDKIKTNALLPRIKKTVR